MTTIGVFDSGFGGLTVLRELLPLIPAAHYIYLGDTARLPYGAKSQATIARYAVESARFLQSRGANLLVIACNTATATSDANVYGQTALINLRGSFADSHPSGVVVETLTIQSIIGTLHANLPQIEQIRFLVDGQPRETLAGHADLTRTYLAGENEARQ